MGQVSSTRWYHRIAVRSRVAGRMNCGTMVSSCPSAPGMYAVLIARSLAPLQHSFRMQDVP
jgi:hypothetical protein